MPRYVDADAMIADTLAMKSIADAMLIEGIVEYIEEHATNDVKKEKRAYWEHLGTYNQVDFSCDTFSCSECSATYYSRTKYCPYCGAKME